MPTDNRRVAAYLPKAIDEHLEKFKHDRGLKGDSPALIAILSEFFGVSQQVAHEAGYSSNFVTLERFESLSSQVALLADRVEVVLNGFKSPQNDLHGKPYNELPKVESIKVLVDNGQIEASNSLVEKHQSKVERYVVLSASELSKRLGFGSSTISKRKSDSAEKFAEWSHSKDPDGITWSFVAELNHFQPVGELPDDVLNNLLSSSSGKPPDTLTTNNLAKRLGVDSSTLSHRKKDKSPQELIEWTRSKDPEKIGWTFWLSLIATSQSEKLPVSCLQFYKVSYP